MSPFIIGLFILGLGVVFGGMLAWWYMSGRVEFWQDKYVMEKRLKDKLMEKGEELLKTELRIFHDLHSAIQTKGKEK